MKVTRCYPCYAVNNNGVIEIGDIYAVFTTEEEAQDWCREQNKVKQFNNYYYDYEITTI